MNFSYLVDPFKSVAGVAIHMTKTIRSSTIAHQVSHLVSAFGSQTPEVPSWSGWEEVSARVLFLWVNEIGKFDWIPDEEEGGIISSHIPVSFFSIKFNCETSRISHGIGGSFLPCHCAESNKSRCHFSNRLEHFSLCILSDIVSDFKITMSSVTFGMHNPFWNSFSIKVG